MDVSQMEQVGYDAIVGALKRQVPAEVEWEKIEELGTIGIDEVATQKGRKRYRAVITARQGNGERHILAVLPDRKKNGQGVLKHHSCPLETNNSHILYRYVGWVCGGSQRIHRRA